MTKDSFIPAVIHGEEVKAVMMESMIGTIVHDSHNRGLMRGYIGKQGCYLDHQRNLCVKQFLTPGREVEWLWFVDSDMVFSPDTPYRLMDSANVLGAKIMSALYFGYPLGTEIDKLYPIWFKRKAQEIYFDKPQVLDWVGMGCCIIHRDVFLMMTGIEDGKWFTYAPVNGEFAGEDVCFCLKAAEYGFDTWGDPAIVAGHLKPRIENVATYQISEGIRKGLT